MEKRRTFRLAVNTLVSLVCAVILGYHFVSSLGFGVFAMRSILAFAAPPAPQDIDGHTNVLLLGVGDKQHSGANLTDSIILASIDPKTRSVVLFSIPRDLYLTDTDGMYPGRINELYSNYTHQAERISGLSASGASALALRSVAANIGKRMGVSIQGVLKMDFTGFENIVDTFGGVDIDVPLKIIDYTFPFAEGRVGTLTIEKGVHHFSGKEALQYARSRHSTSDFDRSMRQQQILNALKAKVQGQNLLDNLGMIQKLRLALQDHFETTFSDSDLFAVGAVLASISRNSVLSMNLNANVGTYFSDAAPGGFVLPAPTALVGSAAVLLPVSLNGKIGDWRQIQTLTSLLVSHRDVYLAHSVFTLIPAGANAQQVQKLRNEFLRYGFTVTPNGETQAAQDTSQIINSGPNSVAARFFSSLLHFPLQQASSATSRVLIILGKDFGSDPFQELQLSMVTSPCITISDASGGAILSFSAHLYAPLQTFSPSLLGCGDREGF